MFTPHPTLRFSDILPLHKQKLHPQFSQRLYLTYNARSALYQLLLSLPKKTRDTVLLPAFHCVALVESVLRAGYRAVFYRITADFAIDLEDLRSKCSTRDALIVVVHFFGFPADLAPVTSIAHETGSYVLEDCAHSFLSRFKNQPVGQEGDFALFSYYKFAPSLTGGGLGVNQIGFNFAHSTGRVPLRKHIVIAKRLIEQAAVNSSRNPLSRLFLWLDNKRVGRMANHASGGVESAPSSFLDDPYSFREDLACAGMPSACRLVLESCNWKEIGRARQKNYRAWSSVLCDTLSIKRALPELPGSVVPWAFPLLLENRVEHEQILRRKGVPLFTFGEMLHPALSGLRDRAREDAEKISSRLLLLPVHPQVCISDIEDTALILQTYLDGIRTDKAHQNNENRLFPPSIAISRGRGSL